MGEYNPYVYIPALKSPPNEPNSERTTRLLLLAFFTYIY